MKQKSGYETQKKEITFIHQTISDIERLSYEAHLFIKSCMPPGARIRYGHGRFERVAIVDQVVGLRVRVKKTEAATSFYWIDASRIYEILP